MAFVLNDGGRAEAGFRGVTGDCVTRTISIITGKPYREVYDALNLLAKSERTGSRKNKISNARTGVFRTTYEKYLKSLGWTWVSTAGIGKGVSVHLNERELPAGKLAVKLRRHLTAIVDGVIHDTWDPSKGGQAGVYGYYLPPKNL